MHHDRMAAHREPSGLTSTGLPMRRSPLLFALLISMACAGGDGTSGVAALTLVEDFRFGDADTGKASLTAITALAFDANGQIWLIDRTSSEIRVFSPKGEYVRTIGRPGVGPGELGATNGFGFAPGGLVWVPDPQAARYSLFDTTGRFIAAHSDLIYNSAYTWGGGVDANGRLYDRMVLRDSTQRAVLRRFRDTSLSLVDTLPYPSCATAPKKTYRLEAENGYTIMAVPFDALEVGAFDPVGNYWCSNGATPGAVKIGVEKGDTLATIAFEMARLAVPPAARDSAIDRISKRARGMGAALPDFSLIPELQPAIIGVNVDGSGRVWLRSPHPTETRYDLFDRDGRQLARVTVPFVIYRYAPIAIRGDTVLGVALNEDDVPTIVRFHLAPDPAAK